MSGEATVDRYGNDVNMSQDVYKGWQTACLQDSTRLAKDGLIFALEEGDEISLTKINGEVKIGRITVRPVKKYVSYQQYIGNNTVVSTEAKRYEAEKSRS